MSTLTLHLNLQWVHDFLRWGECCSCVVWYRFMQWTTGCVRTHSLTTFLNKSLIKSLNPNIHGSIGTLLHISVSLGLSPAPGTGPTASYRQCWSRHWASEGIRQPEILQGRSLGSMSQRQFWLKGTAWPPRAFRPYPYTFAFGRLKTKDYMYQLSTNELSY